MDYRPWTKIHELLTMNDKLNKKYQGVNINLTIK